MGGVPLGAPPTSGVAHVQQFLQVTFSGIATGAIYAIAAVGFSLLWQTAGAINFAHGDFIMLPAIIMLVIGLQEPTLGIPDFVPIIGGANVAHPIPQIGIIAGFAITIPIAIFLLGWVFKVSLVDRLLKPGGDDIPLVIATIGLGLFIREYVHHTFGATPQNFDSVFGNEVWRPGGVAITRNDVGVLIVAVIVILALQLFLNRTYTGRQMEAAAQNAETATVLGIPVKRMILYTFAINAVLCTIAALLVTPTTNARWDGGITLGLFAFTAAIIGGFNQVRGALIGGFLVGVLQNWSGTYLSTAYRDALPLILLIVVILWRPQGLFGRPRSDGCEHVRGSRTRTGSDHTTTIAVRAEAGCRRHCCRLVTAATAFLVLFPINRSSFSGLMWIWAAVLAAVLVALTLIPKDSLNGRALNWILLAGFLAFMIVFPLGRSGSTLVDMGLFAVFTVVVIGQNLTQGFAGQITIAQAAFLGIGAYTSILLDTGRVVSVWGLTVDLPDVPFLWTIPIAVAVSMVLSVLIGMPALRIRGPWLAFVTLAFNLLVYLVLNNEEALPGAPRHPRVPRRLHRVGDRHVADPELLLPVPRVPRPGHGPRVVDRALPVGEGVEGDPRQPRTGVGPGCRRPHVHPARLRDRLGSRRRRGRVVRPPGRVRRARRLSSASRSISFGNRRRGSRHAGRSLHRDVVHHHAGRPAAVHR